ACHVQFGGGWPDALWISPFADHNDLLQWWRRLDPVHWRGLRYSTHGARRAMMRVETLKQYVGGTCLPLRPVLAHSLQFAKPWAQRWAVLRLDVWGSEQLVLGTHGVSRSFCIGCGADYEGFVQQWPGSPMG
ncbi:MAG: hypothetical protein MK101_11950, partial [Phycisphaerales bacterium]|nr:hypothetical protein [Phycisphaerales bacterium]